MAKNLKEYLTPKMADGGPVGLGGHLQMQGLGHSPEPVVAPQAIMREPTPAEANKSGGLLKDAPDSFNKANSIVGSISNFLNSYPPTKVATDAVATIEKYLGEPLNNVSMAAAPLVNPEGEKAIAAAYRAGKNIFNTGKTHMPTQELFDFFNGDIETPVRSGVLEDGFITNRGRFITRDEAKKIHGAATSKQIFEK